MSETAAPDRQEIDALDPPDVRTPEYILDAAAAAAEWQALTDDKRLAGRRSKMTPAIIVKLLTAVRDGLHYEPACALAGVSYETLRNWHAKAEDDGPESAHGRVITALKLAEAEAEGETVRYVRAASRDPRFWAAGMTFLERRHPERWRRPSENTQVQVNVGVAFGVEASEAQRSALVPTVTIAQIPSINADRPALGTSADSEQGFAAEASLSPEKCHT